MAVSLTHVDKPIHIGAVEIKNRVVRTAHATNIGGGTINDDLIAYHEARARGGVGLTILEILGVHATTPSTLNMGDPNLGPGYGRLVTACHAHGMRLFQQLWHGGHHVLPLDGRPPISASDIPSPENGVVPTPMTPAMIEEIIEAYAAAALFCERAGLDGVELHCGHGYLPAQFLSPNFNKREDDYGGSFENRARFTHELVAAVRNRVSSGFAVGVRVAPDLTPRGVGVEDNLRLLRLLEADKLIDFANISLGSYHSFPKLIGGMHEPTGYEMPTSREIARPLNTVTIVTGRFRTLEEADQVIRAGDADMVGLTRATIADPELVSKTLAGEAERVRPCIACNQGCVGGLLSVHRTGCAVNPAAGHELRLGEQVFAPAAQPRRVLVVGGGPAGLEAARCAALRGHQVTLAEAQPDLGGTLRLAAMAPTRHGLVDICHWLEQEVYRLGVDVRLSTYMEAEDIMAEAPDVVIIATGATSRMDGVQTSNPGEPITGMAKRHVISSLDLFLDPRSVRGPSAVVIDDVGHYEGIAAAEALLARDFSVTYVTRHLSLAPLSEPALMVEPALQRMAGKPFRVMARSRVTSIEEDHVLVTSIHAAHEEAAKVAADTVVFISRNQPNRDLGDEVRAQGLEVHFIGDACSPRFLETAIREGRTAAMML